MTRATLSALTFAMALALPLAAGAPAAAQEGETIVKPGRLTIGPYSPRCMDVPTLLSKDLPVGGAALTAPGENGTVRLIVLNPDNLKRTNVETRMFIYAHECAHHIFGESEVMADCYAAMRGRREGWLTEKRLDRVCRGRYITHRSSARYPPGRIRCRIQNYCFQAASKLSHNNKNNVGRVARGALERNMPAALKMLEGERKVFR